jgi:hypothetical protein
MSQQRITFTPPNDDWLTAQVKMIRAKLVRAEQSGLSHRTPEQIREAAKARLKQKG